MDKTIKYILIIFFILFLCFLSYSLGIHVASLEANKRINYFCGISNKLIEIVNLGDDILNAKGVLNKSTQFEYFNCTDYLF